MPRANNNDNDNNSPPPPRAFAETAQMADRNAAALLVFDPSKVDRGDDFPHSAGACDGILTERGAGARGDGETTVQGSLLKAVQKQSGGC